MGSAHTEEPCGQQRPQVVPSTLPAPNLWGKKCCLASWGSDGTTASPRFCPSPGVGKRSVTKSDKHLQNIYCMPDAEWHQQAGSLLWGIAERKRGMKTT